MKDGTPETPESTGSNPAVPSIELLACPFCGGGAAMEEVADMFGGFRKSAGCNTEDCMGYQSTVTFSTYREAAKAWNRRAK